MSLKLYQQQQEAERALLPLLQALYDSLGRGPVPETLLKALVELGTQQAAEPATEALSTTLASLKVPVLPAVSKAVGQRIAAQKAQGLTDRAVVVLAGKSAGAVNPYTRLAAQVLIFDSARDGSKTGAQAGGATHKTFIRVRPAKEPRAHSILEGETLPIDVPFNIDGHLVDGPGDPRLPWSSRAFCGHILRYSRR